MALIKSINENHNSWEVDRFLQPNSLQKIQERVTQTRSEHTWVEVIPNLMVQYVVPSGDDAEDNIEETIIGHWNELITKKDEDPNPHFVVLVDNSHDWVGLQEKIYENLLEELAEKKRNVFWLPLYNYQTQQFVQPYATEKLSLLQKILGSHIRKARHEVDRVEGFEPLLRYLATSEIPTPPIKQMLAQGKVKEEKLEAWVQRLKQAKMWDEDEEIINIAHTRMRRNHFTVNSNFNRSGKLVVTTKRLVFARRSFSLFGFGAAALIPLLAFARPANKVLAFGRLAIQILKTPFQILKPMVSAFWPAIAGIAVSINFIDFSWFSNWLDNVVDLIPSVNLVLPAIDFAIKNPWTIASFGGVLAGLRFGFLRLFFRRERLIYIPHSQLSYVVTDGRELVGRWKVKGHQLVRATDGIQYRMSLRSYDGTVSSQQLTQQIQLQVLTKYQETPEEEEDQGELS